jgi:hypothetical protein
LMFNLCSATSLGIPFMSEVSMQTHRGSL